jgi:hypothetical protein
MFGKAAVSAKIEAVGHAETGDCLVNGLSLDVYRIFARYFAVNVWG